MLFVPFFLFLYIEETHFKSALQVGHLPLERRRHLTFNHDIAIIVTSPLLTLTHHATWHRIFSLQRSGCPPQRAAAKPLVCMYSIQHLLYARQSVLSRACMHKHGRLHTIARRIQRPVS